MGCSEFAFMRARQRLDDLKVIEYQKGTTREAGRYYYSGDYLAKKGNNEVIVGVIPSQSQTNNEPIVGTYIRQNKEQNIYLNQKTDLGTASAESRTETFSKKYPEQYQKLHKDLQGVIDFYELNVKPLQLEELAKLINLNQYFTAGQIRTAIQRFSGSETLGRFKEQGLEYILEPLNKRMFGKRKEEQNGKSKQNNGNVRADAIKGPKYENGPDLTRLKY
jgi:hypothetical protein